MKLGRRKLTRILGFGREFPLFIYQYLSSNPRRQRWVFWVIPFYNYFGYEFFHNHPKYTNVIKHFLDCINRTTFCLNFSFFGFRKLSTFANIKYKRTCIYSKIKIQLVYQEYIINSQSIDYIINKNKSIKFITSRFFYICHSLKINYQS